jgi:hypothetical protein
MFRTHLTLEKPLQESLLHPSDYIKMIGKLLTIYERKKIKCNLFLMKMKQKFIKVVPLLKYNIEIICTYPFLFTSIIVFHNMKEKVPFR